MGGGRWVGGGHPLPPADGSMACYIYINPARLLHIHAFERSELQKKVKKKKNLSDSCAVSDLVLFLV